jgi:hypothetical protein
MQIALIKQHGSEKEEEIRELWNNIENSYPAGI